MIQLPKEEHEAFRDALASPSVRIVLSHLTKIINNVELPNAEFTNKGFELAGWEGKMASSIGAKEALNKILHIIKTS